MSPENVRTRTRPSSSIFHLFFSCASCSSWCVKRRFLMSCCGSLWFDVVGIGFAFDLPMNLFMDLKKGMHFIRLMLLDVMRFVWNYHQSTSAIEAFITFSAFKWFDTRMNGCMTLQLLFAYELFLTHLKMEETAMSLSLKWSSTCIYN